MPTQPNLNKPSRLNNARGSLRDKCTSSASQARTPDGRCHHHRADGKRCASATYPGHTSLCHHHLSRQMRGISDGDTVAADMLSSMGNFQSAAAINIALGKLFVHQITGRISRQDALALAYNCQLLLQTLPAVKAEIRDSGYSKYWKEETQRILSGPSDLEAITAPSLLPPSTLPLHPPDRTPAPTPAVPVPTAPNPATPARSIPAPTTPVATTPAIATPAPPTGRAAAPNSPHHSAPSLTNALCNSRYDPIDALVKRHYSLDYTVVMILPKYSSTGV